MEFKGTKGKWIIEYSNRDDSYDIYNESKDEFVCTTMNSLDIEKYNALLISKAPEMLEKLSEIVNILDIKCTHGYVNKTWIDFQNGNGEDVGLEIDKFIKDTKQLIKEATEL